MTAWYRFERLMTPEGWLAPGWVAVNGSGTIELVAEERPADAAAIQTIPGLAVPGMPNLHSHAFQRGMAGLAERRGPSDDSFWTWRETMYGFLERIDPDQVQAIAAQLYVEMLKAGYTSVAEFHYLHNAPDGGAYADSAEMSCRVLAAARDTGIGLTLLPVLYVTGGFGDMAASGRQRRFVNDFDGYARIIQSISQATQDDPLVNVGLAPHSLRAVPAELILKSLALRDGALTDAPVHIHVAEQLKEVEDCLIWSNMRPVQYLFDRLPVGPDWCLVHATHLTRDELAMIAGSGAVVGLCPTTEADLGDGIFSLPAYLRRGGSFGVGSDSNVATDPFEELRLLEFAQRLTSRARNVAPTDSPSIGAGLYRAALSGGAQALAQPLGAIVAGNRADVIVLDSEHPVLTQRLDDVALDTIVFTSLGVRPRHVMVGGRWIVENGHHAMEDEIAKEFRSALGTLMAAH